MDESKRVWLRYLHDIISLKYDGRASQIRDVLYTNKDVSIEECRIIYNNFNDGYPDILTIEQFTRESKIDQILNDKSTT